MRNWIIKKLKKTKESQQRDEVTDMTCEYKKRKWSKKKDKDKRDVKED
jgi:hypothetical protein